MEELKNYINSIRRDFSGKLLDEQHINKNPFKQFQIWFEEAVDAQILDPYAMALATVGKSLQPSVRYVYMRDITEDGFIFYTNYNSQKAQDIAFNDKVSLIFFWDGLERQIRIEGSAEKVDVSISDAYFDNRPRESQIGAWASDQSNTILSRNELEEKVEVLTQHYKDKPIPRPQHWGGYLVKPTKIEFWQGRPNRLHDRLVYSLISANKWDINRISP